ncbi:hypothetical protein [uncultured Clostridium sp.]|uniref:hypothetical protein n=1 Tax=uncultured Clostridium sp. TaxID=59620 RepID=UPI003217365B
MDLLLQVQYKGDNDKEDELVRFTDMLFNTLKEAYIKSRKVFYILGTISIMTLIYLMCIMHTIIILLIGIIVISSIVYVMITLKKISITYILGKYSEDFLSSHSRTFTLNFYENAIETKFDEQNSRKLVYSWVEKVYETVDMFIINDITWIFKSKLSKEEIVAIKDILKNKFEDKYIELN